MTLPSLYDRNLTKVDELLPQVQWAGQFWLRDCESLGLSFRIIESYRTQDRQNKLYAKGRTEPGPKVTWTRNSFHTKRLACDITPLKGSMEDIEQVANRYGIYRPKELLALGDLGHFQFDKVSKKPPVIINPRAEARRLRRLIELEVNKAKKERLVKRLNKLISLYPSETLV